MYVAFVVAGLTASVSNDSSVRPIQVPAQTGPVVLEVAPHAPASSSEDSPVVTDPLIAKPPLSSCVGFDCDDAVACVLCVCIPDTFSTMHVGAEQVVV